MREYLLVLLFAVGATYLLGGLCRRFAFRFNAVAQVRGRDVHTQPVPYFGGVAMLCGLAAAFLLAANLPWLGSFELVWHDTRGVLLGALVICAVGVIDDMVELNAVVKGAGVLLAASVAVICGVKFYWVPLPGAVYTIDEGTSIAVTLILVFVSANAINLVDGLDGLAVGVVGIGAAAFFTYAYVLAVEQELVRATTSSIVTVATVGVCLGFLPHNVHKAKMFMGDSGALLLGYLMAVSVISLTGQLDPARVDVDGASAFAAYLPLVLPFAVMALPLIDMCMAYFRRSVRGQKWWEPDKQHLHHRMLGLGYGHRQAVALLWLWSAVVSFGVVFVGLAPNGYTITALCAGLLLAAFLTWGRVALRRLRAVAR